MCCFRWRGRRLRLRDMPISGENSTPRPTAVYASDPASPRRPQGSLPSRLLGFERTRLSLASSFQLPLAPRIRLLPRVVTARRVRLSVGVPAPVTRRSGAASGTRFASPPSPRPPPLAPPAPRPVARLRSSASQLLWRSLTSPVRSSSATAPRLPDAIRRRWSRMDERPPGSRAESLSTCQGL